MVNIVKENFVKIMIALISWVFFIVSVQQCRRNDERANDIKNIIESQTKEIQAFKDEAKKWHSIAAVTALNHNESVKLAIKNDPELANIAKEFRSVKQSLKNIKYLGTTSLESKYDIIHHTVRDTVYIENNDTVSAKLSVGFDPNGYYQYRAIVSNNNIKTISISSYDTITTAVTMYRKWLFGRKRYKQEIISRNPNTKITYQKSLIIG